MKFIIISLFIASLSILDAAYSPNVPGLEKVNDDFSKMESQFSTLINGLIKITNKIATILRSQDIQNEPSAIQEAGERLVELLDDYRERIITLKRKEGTLKEYSSQIKSAILKIQRDPSKSNDYINDVFDKTSNELIEFRDALIQVKRDFQPVADRLQGTQMKPIADQAIRLLNSQICQLNGILNRLPKENEEIISDVNSGDIEEIDGFIRASQNTIDTLSALLINVNKQVDTFDNRIDSVAESLKSI